VNDYQVQIRKEPALTIVQEAKLSLG